MPRAVSTVWAIWRWDMDDGTIRNLGEKDLLSEELYQSAWMKKGAR
jgi:hypothetical protein